MTYDYDHVQEGFCFWQEQKQLVKIWFCFLHFILTWWLIQKHLLVGRTAITPFHNLISLQSSHISLIVLVQAAFNF